MIPLKYWMNERPVYEREKVEGVEMVDGHRKKKTEDDFVEVRTLKEVVASDATTPMPR